MFWVIATAMAAIVTIAMLAALLRARRAGGSDDGELLDDPQIAVYRDQLSAVDRDVERGTVSADEAQRLKTEISRRLLEADRNRAGAARQAPMAATVIAAGFTLATVIGGGLYAYWELGAPGYPDLPLQARLEAAAEARENRPTQADFLNRLPPSPPQDVDPNLIELFPRLQAAVAENPEDRRGLELLVQFGPRAGNLPAAIEAQKALWALDGQEVSEADELALIVQLAPLGGDFITASEAQMRLNRADGAAPESTDWANEADLLILATGGYVSPEAEAALNRALEADPRNQTARFYTGLMHSQFGRPDLAFRIWRPLLEESEPEDPWVPPIRQQIEQVASRAGVVYELPPVEAPLRGPTGADMAAAQDMSAEDREAMIEGMIANLSDRLATEGGAPSEWAQLIRALGVVGRHEQAALIWREAQGIFTDEASIAPIRSAARSAGVVRVTPE